MNKTPRKIGSISHCENCGREYVLNSPVQKYCELCRMLNRPWRKQLGLRIDARLYNEFIKYYPDANLTRMIEEMLEDCIKEMKGV